MTAPKENSIDVKQNIFILELSLLHIISFFFFPFHSLCSTLRPMLFWSTSIFYFMFFFFFWFDFICIVVYYSVGWDLIFTWCPEHIVPFGRRSRYGLCIGHEVRGPHLDSDGKNDALYALHGAHNVADIEGIGGIGGIGGSTFGGIAVTPTLPRITHIYNMSDYSDHNLKIAIILCGVREFNRSFLLLGIFLVFYSFSFLSKYAIFV